MKKIYIVLFFLICGFANAQIVNIPDANFKAALLNHTPKIDINNDGQIQVSEAQAVSEIYLDFKNISSLEGIQSFTNLEWLSCNNNNLTSLNLAQNTKLNFIDCGYNDIENLDFSNNPLLITLRSSNNQLTNLNVTQNLNLETLGASSNLLETIDVSHNSRLNQLVLNNNELTDVNLLNNPLLRVFRCDLNQIAELNFVGNAALEVVYCANNMLTSLDFSQNPLLKIVYCVQNSITDIDLSQNPNLQSLECSLNNIAELDFSNNLLLESLACYGNNLTALDLSAQNRLEGLFCFDNQLNILNIRNGNNINMSRMIAYNNPVKCIEVDNINYANSQLCDQANYTGWCKDPIAVYSEFCELGTEEFTATDFQLFPSPTGNLLNIQSKENIESVKIYSSQAILLKDSFSNVIDVSQLSAGMYFAQLTFGGKTFTKKFIKE